MCSPWARGPPPSLRPCILPAMMRRHAHGRRLVSRKRHHCTQIRAHLWHLLASGRLSRPRPALAPYNTSATDTDGNERGHHVILQGHLPQAYGRGAPSRRWRGQPKPRRVSRLRTQEALCDEDGGEEGRRQVLEATGRPSHLRLRMSPVRRLAPHPPKALRRYAAPPAIAKTATTNAMVRATKPAMIAQDAGRPRLLVQPTPNRSGTNRLASSGSK